MRGRIGNRGGADSEGRVELGSEFTKYFRTMDFPIKDHLGRDLVARHQDRVRRVGRAFRAQLHALETQAMDRAFLSTERAAPLHPLLHREPAEPV
jgi:hypothetical protein